MALPQVWAENQEGKGRPHRGADVGILREVQEMTDKTIEGNWIMEKDEVIEGNLTVKGSILGKDGRRFNLTVKGNISAGNILAVDISAWDVSAWDISAGGNISAWDISAGGDVSAVGDISAVGNISAGNISAVDISARDISYYAFCIAYKSIKCRSIKGRRENSFRKCLDGKIEISDKAKEGCKK